MIWYIEGWKKAILGQPMTKYELIKKIRVATDFQDLDERYGN